MECYRINTSKTSSVCTIWQIYLIYFLHFVQHHYDLMSANPKRTTQTRKVINNEVLAHVGSIISDETRIEAETFLGITNENSKSEEEKEITITDNDLEKETDNGDHLQL